MDFNSIIRKKRKGFNKVELLNKIIRKNYLIEQQHKLSNIVSMIAGKIKWTNKVTS